MKQKASHQYLLSSTSNRRNRLIKM
ncbi:hypothetical protein RDABS01_004440 [Bienertia sinuspersici]